MEGVMKGSTGSSTTKDARQVKRAYLSRKKGSAIMHIKRSRNVTFILLIQSALKDGRYPQRRYRNHPI